MWKIIYFIVRYGGAGILSYAMPRLLIAFGVPLDSWIKSLPVWFNHEVAYWLLVAIIGVFIISLTYLVPHLISRKRRNQIEVSSPLKIEVQEDGNAYFRVEDEKGHTPQESKKQVLSIRVYSKEAIDDVKVYISEIETFSYDNDTLQNLLPICLNFKNVKAGNSVSFSADETQQVDVISYSSGRKVCHLQLEQFGEKKKPVVFISSSLICCKMQIKIFGKNVSSSQQSFEIYMKEPLDYNYASNSRQRIFMKRISEEQQGIIDSQQKTIEPLKEQQHPKLEVTFEKGKHPWFQEQPNSRSPYRPNLTYLGDLYTYRIGLMNLGLERILEIQTKLIEVKPFLQELPVVPCYLHFMNDTKQPYAESNNLQMTKNAKSGLFVDVFVYFRVKDVHHLGVYHTVGNPFAMMIPIQSYEITIEISSDNGGEPITKCFRFDPKKEDVKDMMEMLD